MVIPQYYENPHILHVNTMPNRAYFIPDARRNAAHAVLHLVEVVGDAVAANLVELLFEGLERGERGGGGGGQTGAPGVVLDFLGAVLDQEQLAGGGGVT